MIVSEAVDRSLAVAAPGDEPQVPQHAKLMGDGRLADARHLGEVAHAQLPTGEREQETHPGGIRERPEDVDQAGASGFIRHGSERRRNGSRVDDPAGAGVRRDAGII